MRSKSMKMVFVERIIRHKLYMIYAFFDFFCAKIIFDQKLFSYCHILINFTTRCPLYTCLLWVSSIMHFVVQSGSIVYFAYSRLRQFYDGEFHPAAVRFITFCIMLFPNLNLVDITVMLQICARALINFQSSRVGAYLRMGAYSRVGAYFKSQF